MTLSLRNMVGSLDSYNDLVTEERNTVIIRYIGSTSEQ